MRTNMATYLSQLTSAWQSVVKQVNKLSSAGNQSTTIKTTADKLFLLSEVEIFGSTTYSVSGEGTQWVCVLLVGAFSLCEQLYLLL